MNMKNTAFLLAIVLLFFTCKNTEEGNNKLAVKRVGMVIKIKPEMIDEYKRLHADDNPGVRDLLKKYHIQNFSIFLQELEPNKFYEFGYYEYIGDNLESDMYAMAKEEKTIEWLKLCDPMQISLEGHSGWKEMEQIYFNE